MKKLRKISPLVLVFLLMATVLILLNLFLDWQKGSVDLENIRRNDYEDSSRRVTAVLETQLEGHTYRRSVDLTIAPMDLTEEEKAERLDAYEKQLPEIILGNNQSLSDIQTDLDLPSEDPATGITLLWHSSDPARIDDRGRVYPASEPGHAVTLAAVLELDGTSREWSTEIHHTCVLQPENLNRSLDADLARVNEALNQNSSERYASLPSVLPGGASVTWKAPADHRMFFLALLSLLAALFLWRKQESDRKSAREHRRQEITGDFPYFLDKLVMLLSAGVILTEAVYRIWEDYERYQRPVKRKVFYEELGEAVRAMRTSNSSFSQELIRLAERLDIREFARLAVVLRDSLGSGNDLASRLENESILMWRERKNAVQKLGRVADTKLIFPLMIILTVLIIIVMTPAILQM